MPSSSACTPSPPAGASGTTTSSAPGNVPRTCAPVFALGGNYGLVYRFALAAASTLALALAPRGGAWGGAGDLFPGADGATPIVQFPSASEALSSTTQAIAAGRFAASMPVMLALITAGGSNLPVDLLTVPLP